MGRRRVGPEDIDQVIDEVDVAAASELARVRRRSDPWIRRGVLFFSIYVLVLGCRDSAQPATTQSPTAAELNVAFPEGNVPGSESGLGQFAGLLTTEGLAEQSVDGRVVPRLVESWQWENDDLTLRLRLRPDVFFHDGSQLDSAVVTTILRDALASPERRQSYASLDDVKSVTADGDREVVIQLLRRSGFLLDDLTMPLANAPGSGTGPYRVLERSASELVFDRFDKYYQGVPAIRRIRVRAFDTVRAAWSALLREEVEMVTDVPAEAVEFVRTDDVDVITYERWFQFLVAFNSTRSQFRSPAVRQALNQAVDRDLLIRRVLRGYATPATGPVWPRHWAYDQSVRTYTFDPRHAEMLLEGSGLHRSEHAPDDGVPPDARLRFTCLLASDFSLHERMALELQKQLYDIGVDMQFETVPLKEYLKRLESSDFDAVLIDMNSGPTLGRLYIYWSSADTFKGRNPFGYKNAHVERLFRVLRESTTNEAAVRSATRDLQRAFLDDPPALFLAWNQRTRAVRKTFQVVREPNRDPMATLWRWTIPGQTLTASR